MIELRQLNIQYGDNTLVKDGQLSIFPQTLTLIVGKSGSGKTTLLYRMSLMSQDTNYYYHYYNIDLMALSEDEKVNFRSKNFGIVLQDPHLMESTVYKNLEYASMHLGHSISTKKAKDILKKVKLNVLLDQNVETLSGGEKQRLAIACALIKEPSILILDEPTSSLDKKNGQLIFEILKDLVDEHSCTVIVTSHSDYAKLYADNIYEIKNQDIVSVQRIDKVYKDSNEVFLNKYKVSFKSYLYYLKSFFNRYLFMNLMMIGISIFLLVSILSSVCFSNTKIDQGIATIKLNSDNQILVLPKTDSDYPLNTNDTLTKIDYDRLKSILYIENIHPFIYANTYLYDREVFILPYYEQSKLNNKIESKRNIALDNGVMLSQTLFNLCSSTSTSKGKNLDYLTFISDLHYGYQERKTTIQNTMTFFANEKLKNGVKEYYSDINGNDNFILVPYKQLEKYFPLEKEPLGYVIFIDQFDHIRKVEDLLLKDYNIIYTSNETKLMENVFVQVSMLLAIILGVLLVISIVLNVILNIHYFTKRKVELFLLMVNGLTKKDILNMHALQFMCTSVVSIGVSVLCLFPIGVLLDFSVLPYLNLLIILAFGVNIVIVVFMLVIMEKQISKITVENTLRE